MPSFDFRFFVLLFGGLSISIVVSLSELSTSNVSIFFVRGKGSLSIFCASGDVVEFELSRNGDGTSPYICSSVGS